MAILYCSNYSSRAFERIFKSVGIPYVIYGGVRFYERQEIKDALCYLRLCTNRNEEDPDQMALDLAVLRVINVLVVVLVHVQLKIFKNKPQKGI